MKVKDYLLNIISPPKCVACNCRLPIDCVAMFCEECSGDYHLNNGATCEICGKPIHKDRDKTCSVCKQGKIYYIKNVSRYKYKGSIKTAIQNMKFRKRCWIAFEFGRAMCKTIEKEYGDIKFDMILYVPMSPVNELLRGFNQSYEMAQIIGRKLKVPVNGKILFKKSGIKTQSGLGRKERMENIKNAFTVLNPHLLTDKTVLLIDDVFTTGSTVNECAKILKRNGALAVYVATLATVIYD